MRYECIPIDERSEINIRRIIAAMNSVAVRGRGGVYFIPYSQLDALQRLNRFIADLPTPSLPAISLASVGSAPG